MWMRVSRARSLVLTCIIGTRDSRLPVGPSISIGAWFDWKFFIVYLLNCGALFFLRSINSKTSTSESICCSVSVFQLSVKLVYFQSHCNCLVRSLHQKGLRLRLLRCQSRFFSSIWISMVSSWCMKNHHLLRPTQCVSWVPVRPTMFFLLDSTINRMKQICQGKP